MVYQWIVKGGDLMWPIVGLSVVALAIILERCFYWLRYAWRRDPALRRDVVDGRLSGDLSLMQSRDPVAEVAHWYRVDPLRGKLLADKLQTANRRGLGALETIASLSTSLGLFGTVVGVSLSFDSMASGDAEKVVYGLGVALFTTVLGLVVHLACLICAGFFQFFATEVSNALDVAAACGEEAARARAEAPRELRVVRDEAPRGQIVLVDGRAP
jgi:biopolymer transport protein ExbB